MNKLLSRPALELFVISMLSLYFELVVIRWLSSEIRIFAYFKNIPLMACLFGLGLGMALAGSKKDWSRWFPAGILALVLIICLAAPLNLVHVSFLNPLENYLIGAFIPDKMNLDSMLGRLQLFVPGLLVLVSVFYLMVFTFVGIGQRIGRLFQQFEPLVGYTINVFASLAGIALFTIASFLSLPPTMWLVIGLVPCVFYYRRLDQLVAMACSLIVAFAFMDAAVRWSPYYRITVHEMIYTDPGFPPFKYGYNIAVNYDSIEGAYNNNPAVLAKLSKKQLAHTADYYDTPYMALGDKPRSVLVLAAGTGNDVAAALRHGATDVDAVEIDPTIAKIGREIHPEQPYSDPRVHLIVDDARAYLRRTNKKYDLIVFAYLDSHTAFSSMSSLRLDNYVYTKECFADASKLLKKDGVMSVTFYFLTWWQLARVYHSLEEGFGTVPIGVFSPMGNGPTLLVGPGLDQEAVRHSGLKMLSLDDIGKEWKFTRQEWNDVCPTTDDWPFLFLREPGVSWMYAIGLIFTLFLGYGLVGRAFGKFTGAATGRAMFFLGAAFMLIETKSVTQMGLLAGTTWIVNSCVIACVLMMILLANLVQLRYQFKNLPVLYGLLFAAIAGNMIVKLSVLNGLPPTERLVIGSLILGAPLLFAAMIFAATFSTVKEPNKALGMNLLGTLIGGALEYLSMVIGVSALNIVAALLYGAAFYFSTRQEKPEAASDDSSVVIAPAAT